ncbi:hypothetical protein F4821DRAFT_75412 [Hypoxylon rubiginosum]|uniref:Uncharacterized protein n=1 Tax=Hypoxylon rubiginosum TaxID=110542 RepID=A0ACC0DKJ4_9PEZI|nr:hypothetical protein F4821DRAFT_75412 [Hypoxylon rubiginosum]
MHIWSLLLRYEYFAASQMTDITPRPICSNKTRDELEETGNLVHTETKAVNGTISILQNLRPRDSETELSLPFYHTTFRLLYEPYSQVRGNIGYECKTDGCRETGNNFSYFTVLTYWGIAFYFTFAAIHTFTYARTGTALLDRWPCSQKALHVLLFTSIATLPFLVTIVYCQACQGPNKDISNQRRRSRSARVSDEGAMSSRTKHQYRNRRAERFPSTTTHVCSLTSFSPSPPHIISLRFAHRSAPLSHNFTSSLSFLSDSTPRWWLN